LRERGRRRRARVRALLDGRLADRVHDLGPLPVEPRDRRVRLLLAGRRERTRLRRLLQRPAVRVLRRHRRDALDGSRRRADLRRGDARRRRRLRRLDLGLDRRRGRALRPRAAALPARRVRRRLGERRHAPPARLLAPLRRQAPMRKWLLIGGGLAVLALGIAAGAYVLVKQRQARDVHGSPTVEFVTTAAPTVQRPREPGVLWEAYGFDEERARVSPYVHRPPFRRLWRFSA